MTFKFKNEDQTITVYNLRADTSEFIGVGDAYIPANTGLPAYCTEIAPPDVEVGYAAVFDCSKKSWQLVEDHRDSFAYDIETGAALHIQTLGPLPENTTQVQPTGPYQKWNGKAWVDDKNAMTAGYQSQIEDDRQALLSEANLITADWRTELMLDEISDVEKTQLKKWMAYIKDVKNYDASCVIDEASYSAFKWPSKPE